MMLLTTALLTVTTLMSTTTEQTAYTTALVETEGFSLTALDSEDARTEIDGSLRAAKAVRHKTDDGVTLLDGVRRALDENLSRFDRVRLGRKVLSPKRVAIVLGSFPGEGTAAVTVNVPLRSKDPDAAQKYISSVLILDAEGELVSVVVPPKMRPERFDLLKLGDTDSDGHDDLVLSGASEASTTQQLVRWGEELGC